MQEAAKAERRERERQHLLEREREREGRERAAKEHFAALQRQRREQARQAKQAQREVNNPGRGQDKSGNTGGGGSCARVPSFPCLLLRA